MSTKYYVKDENGKVLSIDGKTRYRVYENDKAISFLRSKAGRGKFFFITTDEFDNPIYIEVDKDFYKQNDKEEQHAAYLERQKCIAGYKHVSINDTAKGLKEDIELIDMIADETADIDVICDRREMYGKLHNAMKHLTEEEMDLVVALFCLATPLTEWEYAKKIGITQATVNYRKKQVLEKIKKFL